MCARSRLVTRDPRNVGEAGTAGALLTGKDTMRLASGITAEVVSLSGSNESVGVGVRVDWPDGRVASSVIRLVPDERFTLDQDELLVIDKHQINSPRVVCRATTAEWGRLIRDLLNKPAS